MPRSKFYAVKSGRNTGIYNNWTDCKNQVERYSGQQYKSFNSKAEAQAYMDGGSSGSGSAPSSGSSRGSSSNQSEASPVYIGSHFTVQSNTPYSRPPPRASSSSSSSYSGYAAPAPPRSSASGRHVQEVYTDGSCIGNGKKGAKAGWGAYWGDSRDACGAVKHTSTNNAGELTAIKETLKEINRNPGKSDYRIYSDSEYSIQAVGKWADKWQKQGWKTSTGEPVKNREIIEDVRSLMKEAKERGIKVELEKVKGHANIPGNEAADRLARRGASY